MLKLQIKMNVKGRCIQIRVRSCDRIQHVCRSSCSYMRFKTSEHTEDVGALQKAEDFIRAFVFGFDINVRNYARA